MNDYTEHYSALKAEVVIDAETDMNQDLIRYMNEFDRIEFAGEASSHCVGNTLVHFIDTIAPDDAAKVVVLENATSPVPGCAHKIGRATCRETDLREWARAAEC